MAAPELAPGLRRQLLAGLAAQVAAHAGELGALDRAIGDGDHGVNLQRGFDAVLALQAELCAQPLPQACEALGRCLVMSVGGASGPLYGTLFIALGRALREHGEFAPAFAAAVAAVGARGRSQPGQKSLLDVLVPLQARLAAAGAGPTAGELCALADAAAAATIPMRATCGRAAFLGERSVGHMDPGARSAALLVQAACRIILGQESQAS